MVRGFWFFSFKKLNYLRFWFWLWFWNLKFDEWYEDFDFEWKICSLTSDWWALVLKKKGSICLSTLNAPHFNTNTIDFNRWFQSKVRWCVHWQARLTNYRKGYEKNSTEKKNKWCMNSNLEISNSNPCLKLCSFYKQQKKFIFNQRKRIKNWLHY